MIRRGLLIAVLSVVAVVVQTAMLPRFELAGFRPDLLLLVTVLFALRDGPFTGVRVGFGVGLLQDLLLVQTAMGTSALVLMAIGYAVGRARPQLNPDAVFAPPAVAFGATFVGTAGFGVLSALLGSPSVTPTLLLQACLLTALYNTLLSPFVVVLVDRVDAWMPLPEAALA